MGDSKYMLYRCYIQNSLRFGKGVVGEFSCESVARTHLRHILRDIGGMYGLKCFGPTKGNLGVWSGG